MQVVEALDELLQSLPVLNVFLRLLVLQLWVSSVVCAVKCVLDLTWLQVSVPLD